MNAAASIKIAILAISAKQYGHDAYFRGLLPALARMKDRARFVLFARDDRYAELCKAAGNVELRIVPWKAGLAGLVWEQFALPFVLYRESFDVLFTAKNAGLLLSSVPFVTCVQNMDPLRPLPSGLPIRHAIRHTVLRGFTIASAKRAARVIAVSEHVRKTLLAHGVPAGKIGVIYNAVDDQVQEASKLGDSSLEKERFVLSAAKFVRYANLELLFRSFAKLRKMGYQGDLRFAGGSFDHIYEGQIRELVEDLGIKPHVRFLGYIPRADLRQLMRRCDAFLFSSTLEACPFTLLEAMRAGAAIVSTNCPPMPEFCGDAALYAEPDDADGFAQASSRIISNAELKNGLSQRAERRAGAFRWNDSADRLVGVLEEAQCASS